MPEDKPQTTEVSDNPAAEEPQAVAPDAAADAAAPDAAESAAEADDSASPEGDIETDPVEMVVCPGCKAEIDTTEVPPFSTIQCPACGAAIDVPAKFGAFRLLKVLGSGGMGSVFLGQDDALNRKVAIKVVKRSIGGNAGMLEGFQKEAQATAKLNHPNIVQIYAFGEEKGQPYIAMELVGGGSLDGLIEAKRKLDPAFVLRVGKEIAIALGAAQEAGLIHGDVKPENILFDETYRAKLVDFGIASALAGDSNSKEIWGTPYYIAPEKARGKKADIRSDLYSLGATLYHALTLHPPFDGPDARAVVAARYQGPPAPIGKYRPDAEKKAIEIIERMMHPNPMLRFPTVASLVASIDEFLKSVPAARAEKPSGGTASVRIPAAKAKTAAVTGPATSATGSVAPAKKGGKKIIIARGGSRPRLTVPSAPSQESIPEAPEEFDAVPTAFPPPVVEEPPKRNAAKVVIITVATLLLLVLLGVVGVFVYLVRGEKESNAASAALAAEAAEIEKSAEALDKRVADAAARVLAIDKEARKLVSEIEDIASKASETKWTAPSLDPTEDIAIDPPKKAEAKAEAPAPAAAPAPKVETLMDVKNDPVFDAGKNPTTRKAIITFAMTHKELASNPELVKKLLEIVHDPENAKDADVMEAAVKLALDAAKKAAEEAEASQEGGAAESAAGASPADALNSALNAMGGEVPAEAAAAMQQVAGALAGALAGAMFGGEDAAAAPAPEHEIIVKAKAALEPARRIRRAAKEAELRRDRQSEVFTPIKGDSVTTAQYNERVQFKQTRENDEKKILASIEACQKDLAALKKDRTLLERESKKFLEAIRVRQAEEEKAKEARLAAAREEQADNERKARIQRDLDEVELQRQGVSELISDHDYAKAVAQLSAFKGQYAAKEANERLAEIIDRYQRMADLREFILKDLHENNGLSWGLGTRDIVDADPAAGTVTARGGATAPVSKLTLKQWMGLIDRLVAKREQNRPPMTMKQECDALFGAAIFCIEHGNGSESALKKAEELARAAVAKSEVIRMEIPRVAPELKPIFEDAEAAQ